MDAALDLIWEESYGAVTIDDICKRAEVKKGSFYYFFSSKSELAIAALERMWAQTWKPAMDAAFSPSIDPLKRIGEYLASIHRKQVAIKQEHGRVLGCPIVSVGSETSTLEGDVNVKIREILNRKRRYYESAIRDALAEGVVEPCDPVEKANALVGLIEGIVCQCRIMNDPQIAQSLPEIGLKLIGAKEATAQPNQR